MYRIVLSCDRMLDRSGCDFKLSNKRAVGKCAGIVLGLGTNSFRMGSSNSSTPQSACASTRTPSTGSPELGIVVPGSRHTPNYSCLSRQRDGAYVATIPSTPPQMYDPCHRHSSCHGLCKAVFGHDSVNKEASWATRHLCGC